MSSVHIEVSPNGTGKVVIDGHDIAKSVTGFTVHSQVGHTPRLELDLRAHDVTTFEAPHVQVLIDPTTAGFLERAGWTPPPGVESVLTRDADGCPCERHTWRERADGVLLHPDDPDGEEKSILGRTVPTCPVHGVNSRKSAQ